MDMTEASSRTLDNLRRHCVYRGVMATMIKRRWYYFCNRWPLTKADMVTEASALGFKPGCWPREFVYDGKRFHHVKTEMDNSNEDIACMVYRSVTFSNGERHEATVRIYND